MGKIQNIKITQLDTNNGQIEGLPKNPRFIKDNRFKQLVKSIEDAPEMLDYRTLLVFPHDKKYVIIAGNMRFRACKEIGYKELPCYVLPEETPAEKLREYAIKDNIGFGADDWDILMNEWNTEELQEWGMEMPDDWQGNEEETEIEEDEIPEEVETRCKRGDVWILGEHRLMCGDSTKAEDVEKLMNGQKADMVFTDPPYDFETQGGGIFGGANSMRQVRENGVDKFDPSVLTNYAKTNIYFHNRKLIKSYIELAERDGLNYDLAIYKKQGLPNFNGHLMTDIEYISVIGEQDPKKGLEMRYYSKVFEGKKDSDNELSYSKPIAICDKFIQLYSTKHENVLDLFGGSGSTLIACEQLNRKCYTMELDEHYCDVIISRWEKLTEKKAEKIN